MLLVLRIENFPRLSANRMVSEHPGFADTRSMAKASERVRPLLPMGLGELHEPFSLAPLNEIALCEEGGLLVVLT